MAHAYTHPHPRKTLIIRCLLSTRAYAKYLRARALTHDSMDLRFLFFLFLYSLHSIGPNVLLDYLLNILPVVFYNVNAMHGRE